MSVWHIIANAEERAPDAQAISERAPPVVRTQAFYVSVSPPSSAIIAAPSHRLSFASWLGILGTGILLASTMGRKEKNSWFGSLDPNAAVGSLSDAKGEVGESLKQTGIALLAGLGGLLLGSAVGKGSLAAGIGTIFGGAYFNSLPLVAAGVGMMGGSNRQINDEQMATINAKHPKDSLNKQLAIAQAAATNKLNEIGAKTYVLTQKNKDVPNPPTQNDKAVQNGLGYAGAYYEQISPHNLAGTAQTVGDRPYIYSGVPATPFDILAIA